MCVCISVALLKFYPNIENLDINEDVLHSYFLFCRGMLGGVGCLYDLGVSVEVGADTAKARRASAADVAQMVSNKCGIKVL